MSAHTPGPWRVVHTADDRTFIDTEVSSNNFIAQVDRNIPEYEENAAFIVRACNSHEELITALKSLVVATTNDGQERFPGHYTAYLETVAKPRALAAIAKAEGRPA